ncbi:MULTISPECIES: MerR family transcriptional regulator [unclassified Hyphomonas]|jgi:DNA-binding transcriptional MerR regulator|uniref:MerR family transcriptional regulator n=1 Tax=unclassified Hyphomonas TaxID=2630699 RepID=UPI000C64DA99|nr:MULTISPECIES: helix-turn-helix domain-containing protein [unclassified Hyphomonas]MAL43738.1 MerR family transcriptional regulator [Hyphomonas sp.]MAX84533.1 MerR family transcriptional regulator [Hyphomonas sp.]HBN94019.1 MerR family transcriptional regulator [Hyphomonas sp.]HBT36978.1 MerR family transcriptional regulator [Hyphomonas sp.]HBU32898.1 MerR family transcriptional regulator [Hyphomonas sp.]|tara:strand:+ start:7547 stop:7987 length:441 start_codon:yes stop_codon:yes gene_type:complete
MKPMTIGRLSKAAGVKVTTIRYYESIGLMGEPDRSDSGQRLYGDDAVQRLSFIRHGRELGFPMNAIRELIALQADPGEDCSVVEAIAEDQLQNVRRRLKQLRALERELKRMVTGCGGGKVETCQIMAALNNHDACLSKAHERVQPI